METQVTNERIAALARELAFIAENWCKSESALEGLYVVKLRDFAAALQPELGREQISSMEQPTVNRTGEGDGIGSTEPSRSYREQIVAEVLEQAAQAADPVDESLATVIRALSPSPNFLALKVAEAELREFNSVFTNWNVDESIRRFTNWAEHHRADLERRVLELGGTL